MRDSLRPFKASIFHALWHPTRIAMLAILGDRELPLGAIIERLGLEQANALLIRCPSLPHPLGGDPSAVIQREG
jgi:DNA-binding transcriptional ArsR family regulator